MFGLRTRSNGSGMSPYADIWGLYAGSISLLPHLFPMSSLSPISSFSSLVSTRMLAPSPYSLISIP